MTIPHFYIQRLGTYRYWKVTVAGILVLSLIVYKICRKSWFENLKFILFTAFLS